MLQLQTSRLVNEHPLSKILYVNSRLLTWRPDIESSGMAIIDETTVNYLNFLIKNRLIFAIILDA